MQLGANESVLLGLVYALRIYIKVHLQNVAKRHLHTPYSLY